MARNEPLENYKVVIYDRFCEDVRTFNKIVRRRKIIEHAGLRFNEEDNEWEMNVIFTDKTTMTLKEKVILDFIGECEYKEDIL